MIINPAIKTMIKEAKKVHLTPREIESKEQFMTNMLSGIQYNQAFADTEGGIARAALNLPVEKIKQLLENFPQENFMKVNKKLSVIIKDIIEKNKVGYNNEAERFFYNKRLRTELKRELRNDEKSQKFLKEIRLLLDDKNITSFIEEITDVTQNHLGLKSSFEEFLYNMDTSSKEWKYGLSQKIFLDKKPIDQFKEFISYLIKQSKN